MSIGSVTVDLLAKTGSFTSDLDRAAKHAEKRAREMDAAMTKAGAAIGASLAAAGIAAVYFGKQLVDGLDALNDVKDATGSSIENLSALENVALRTGTNLEGVSGILVKFNNVLKELDGKSAASEAIKKLGLDAEELKRIDPAEALRQTAVALTKFADDGDKARVVQELFGKSVKDAAPFLKDLAEQTELVGTVTAEQAENAEIFNKQLFALEANAVDAGRAFLKDLLPALSEVLNYTKDAEGGTTLLNAALSATTTVFQALVVLASDVAFVFKGVGTEIGGVAAQIGALLSFDFKGFSFIGKAMKEDAAKARSELDAFQSAIMNPGSKVTAATGGSATTPARSIGTVRALSTGKKAGGPKETEIQKYLEGLDKQLLKTKELGVAATALAEIESGRLGKVTPAEKALAISKGEQLDALKAMGEYTKLSAAAEEERTEALLRLTTEQESQSTSLLAGNKTLREEVELIGKNVEAQAAIEQARLSSAIALKQEELVRRENAGALIRETDAIRAQIEALTERKDLVGMRGVAQKLADDAAEAKQFASQVGAAFESSFEKAILEGGKLSDVLKGLAKDILGLYIRNSITGPLAKSIGGAAGGFNFSSLSSLFSGGGGFGTGSAYGNQDFGGFFANGGNPPAGKISVVGEMGPELFVPNGAGTIIPNSALGGGGGGTNVYNFTVGDVATASMVREAVANSERRTANGFRRSRSYAGEAA